MSRPFKQHPTLPQGFSDTFEKRFWKYVDKNGPIQPHCPELGPCWVWTGGITDVGYGNILTGGRNGTKVYSHRTSWLLHYGAIPEGRWVLHRCDCRRCVRPDHLFLGSPLENMLDKERKGRGNHLSGEQKTCAKLTWAKVRELRRLRTETGEKFSSLGAKFGISENTASLICRHLKWKRETLANGAYSISQLELLS